MLRLQVPLDEVMTALLATALQQKMDWLTSTEHPGHTQYDTWTQDFPRSARRLSRTQLKDCLLVLRVGLISSDRVYRLSALHRLLLMEVLQSFVTLYEHEDVGDIACPELRLGPYPLQFIDLDAIMNIFFGGCTPECPHTTPHAQPVTTRVLELSPDDSIELVRPREAMPYYNATVSQDYPSLPEQSTLTH